MEKGEAFDVVIIGSGFTGLGIAAVFRKKDEGMSIALVAREEKPGGIWTQAAETVKLHQQTYFYALPNLLHDDPMCHKSSVHQASSSQVRSYAEKVARSVGCILLKGEASLVLRNIFQRIRTFIIHLFNCIVNICGCVYLCHEVFGKKLSSDAFVAYVRVNIRGLV